MNTVPYKKYNTFASVQKSTVPWHFNSTLHVNVLVVQLHQLYKLYYMADTDTKCINSSHLYTDQKHVSQKLMLQYLHFSSPSPLAVFHSINAHESV